MSIQKNVKMKALIITVLYLTFLCGSIKTQFDIRLPPSIIRSPPKHRIYRTNDSITLDCKGTGVPNVTYEWKKNGLILNATLKYIKRNSDGSITIQPATLVDEGFYQCFSGNQYGTALSITAHLQMAILDYTRRNTTDVLNITVDEGGPFHISCDQRRSFPKPTYIWEVANETEDSNQTELRVSNRIQIADNGDLHFAFAIPDDQFGGQLYRCSTYNPYLGITAEGSFTRLIVGPDPFRPVTPPGPARRRRSSGSNGFFSESPTVAIIGGSVTLRCFFNWKSSYRNWYNGQFIATMSKISWIGPGLGSGLLSEKYTMNAFRTSFTMENITASDEGYYRCEDSENSHNFKVNVEAVPMFPTVADAPYDVNVTEGESFTFKCDSVGKPQAKIVWLQDGKQLDPNNPLARFAFSNNRKSLTIRDVCRDCVDRESKTDLMVIQCNASNVHGYAFAQGYLNVLNKTMVTVNGDRHQRQRIVESSESKEIQFTCNATSDPSTPPSVSWNKMKNDKEPPVHIYLATVSLNNGTLTIHVNPNATLEWTTYQIEYKCTGSNGYSNDSSTIDIILTDAYCESEFDEDFIPWNRTEVGTEISRPCPGKKYGYCSRKCLLNSTGIFVWSETNCKLCYDKEFGDLLNMVSDLEATTRRNQTAVAEFVSQLSTFTNKSEGLNSGNLNASVRIISRLGVLRSVDTSNPTKGEIQSFVDATSNILQPNNSNAWKELEQVNATFASNVLFAVEVYGHSLSMLNTSNCDMTEGAENLVIEALSLENSNQPPELEFPNCTVWSQNKISIPTEALQSSSSSEDQSTLNMWGSYYRTIHNYLPGNKDFGNISSKVLSFTIGGPKTNETLRSPVLITLQHNQSKRMSYRRTCAFWNFDRDDWDTAGCLVLSTTLTHTICSCDHLSNFAMFMSTEPVYDEALSIISIIGCSISVAALILTIVVYAVTWKQAKSSQATVLLNLCIALIIAYIIFMAGADKVDSEIGCTVVAVLLHYFFLVAFFIMLAEGVELLIYIIFVFHVRRTRETIMLIAAAWVLPLIIVAVSLGSSKVEGYGNGYACWLSVDRGLIWAFLAPVLFIIMVNIVILIIVLVWMSRKKSVIAINAKKRNEIRATLWNLSVTCPVLGLGWLLGVFSLASNSNVFQYLFVIVNSPQGLLIFIFHALFHNKIVKEKISDFYTDYICRCRKTVYEVSNKMSSIQELDKKKDNPGSFQMTGHDNKGLEAQESFLSAGTQTTSIDDSSTLEKAL